jgi:hypothetical protein
MVIIAQNIFVFDVHHAAGLLGYCGPATLGAQVLLEEDGMGGIQLQLYGRAHRIDGG